jgi:hypothetical protein
MQMQKKRMRQKIRIVVPTIPTKKSRFGIGVYVYESTKSQQNRAAEPSSLPSCKLILKRKISVFTLFTNWQRMPTGSI